ncbi:MULTISPECIES: hypothetical protein [Cyclobacteriaceae]|uniref:Uncharacterized protein n=2 Tax=Cyclobacteriaceae TaxID=563798 RepID=A0A1W2H0X7_9BACT|nr:hypothetical protein [Aquiflexum balticum]GMQ29018.1 hypothetical protein Aconfl_16610 [Algoriphagus confluentis]SMD42531.1 hypothetical protein SAMN00777080_1087 [Aquiflexum balticum DSM 16537]
MKKVIQLIGVIFLLIGGYFAVKAGYHLLNYELTWGLNQGTFGYARPYWEIVVEFLFWLTVIIGGLGFLTSKKLGLKIGSYSLILPILTSSVFLIISISKKLDYSNILMVNNESRKMSLREQWEYIYSEPIYFAVLVLALITIMIVSKHQFKVENGYNNSSKKKIYLMIFTLLIVASCAEKRFENIQYQNGNQILNVNSTNRNGEAIEPVLMKAISPDTVEIGELIDVKVFLSQPNFKIVDASFDCEVSDMSLADTTNNKIIGCSKGLFVENDTVRIQFNVGGDFGEKDFPEIVILSKGDDNVYRYHKGTFNYFVKR